MKSLEEVHSSVETSTQTTLWKRLFAFMGPAYLVSVGYMDPGNWATDIAGGSRYGYALIWVLVMSNLMALLLQSLSARLGIVRGLDLAQASAEAYHPAVNFFNWLLCEIAIAACDLAEVLGMAIGLQLLFGLPLLAGVSITVFDTLILLVLQKYGMRKMEAFILMMIATIGIAFIIEMILAKPDGAALAKGVVPSIPDTDALYIAIGIIGATVMPHNLYLHSSLVQTRNFPRTAGGMHSAIKFNLIDTVVALNLALFVNAAILILAAAAFHGTGRTDVEEIQDAHHLLEGILGTSLAPILFATALIASGQSSTLTGTLSGQIVMEGYLKLRIQPWLRRLITRLIAIIPAFLVIWLCGEEKTGDLLVLSQVILSMQLGFAVIPLIHFTGDKATMGEFAIKPWVKICAWTAAGIIVSLNVNLVIETISGWISVSSAPWIIYTAVVPAAAAAGCLLLYVTFSPFFQKMFDRAKATTPHGALPDLRITEERMYRHIAVAVDFSEKDSRSISHALSQGGASARYLLIHVVETAAARIMYDEAGDLETESDAGHLKKYAEDLKARGYRAEIAVGYGNPKRAIPEIVNARDVDLLIMGAHGHRGFKDVLFGTTVDAVRHNVRVPLLIVG